MNCKLTTKISHCFEFIFAYIYPFQDKLTIYCVLNASLSALPFSAVHPGVGWCNGKPRVPTGILWARLVPAKRSGKPNQSNQGEFSLVRCFGR